MHSRVWDLHSSECVHTLEGHTEAIHCVTYDSSGGLIVSGSEDSTVRWV